MATSSKFPTGNILVTTDFSDSSCRAFCYAEDEARERSAKVELVNVFEEPVVPTTSLDFLPPVPVSEEIRKELWEASEKNLKEAKKKYFRKTSCSTKVLEQKYSVGETIVEYATRTQAALIVIASQGHGFLARVLLGSVAEKVLRHATCPVLAVPSDKDSSVENDSSKDVIYRNIIVTTDLSPASEAALSVAKHHAERTGATLTVLHVIESPYAPELFRMEWRNASDDAREIQNRYRSGIERRVHELANGMGAEKISAAVVEKEYSVPHTLAKFARETGSDLVVIATRGIGKRVNLIGGIVERFTRHMPCPVMVVPGGRV